MSKSNTVSKTGSPVNGSRTPNTKNTKTIVLKVPSSILARYAPKPQHRKSSQLKAAAIPSVPSSPLRESTPASEAVKPTQKSKTRLEPVKSEEPPPVITPEESIQAPPSTSDSDKKDEAELKAGIKRPFGAIAETTADNDVKPRAKPGPKRRKLDGTTLDDATSRPWTTPAPLNGHKLGPKANQGAINAGLRALDRTGKPCRKWEKKGFAIKSFTGVVWDVPSWNTPKKATVDSKDDSGGTPNSNGENIANNSSSAVGSEPSRNGNADSIPLPSSPALAAVNASA
ncbi:hypothetical protein MMC25_003139 [Agyrium rufum]|nr:hypothetical protein [Agyrium rufum]